MKTAITRVQHTRAVFSPFARVPQTAIAGVSQQTSGTGSHGAVGVATAFIKTPNQRKP